MALLFSYTKMNKINRSVAHIFRFLIGAKDLEGQSIFSDLSRLTNLTKFSHFVKQINLLLFAITHWPAIILL